MALQLLWQGGGLMLCVSLVLCSWCRDSVEHQSHIPICTFLGPCGHGKSAHKQQQQHAASINNIRTSSSSQHNPHDSLL
jgi:hypothetical protein